MKLLFQLISIVLISFLYTNNGYSQLIEPIANVYDRTTISLDGDWNYIVDPMKTGLNKAKYRRDFPADEKADLTVGDLIEYDWDSSPTLKVPGDWNSQVTELDWYEGLVWYRKKFEFKPSQKRHFLYFEAVNYLSHIYLNGQKIAQHEGGFTPFMIEVTGKLKAQNSLVVAVNNERIKDGIPAADFDWWNYGGITRSVHLIETEPTFISDYRFSLSPSKKQIEGSVEITGTLQGQENIEIAFPNSEINVTIPTNGQSKIEFTIAIPQYFKLWSPEAPNLHEVEIRFGKKVLKDKIGFKTVETEGYDIKLNGKSIFLRGICLHEEAYGKATRALDWASAKALLMQAKELNANFVRLAHYPHTEKMTRLADSLGLMVWTEIPVYWEDIDYQNPKTLALARNMLMANYERDKNRASIILWSVANETPIHRDRMLFLKQLIQDLKQKDERLLVTAALKVSHEGGVKSVDDPLGAFIDVVAVNTYVGWYGQDYPDKITDIKWETTYQKPMVFSEFGAGAVYGSKGDSLTRWTENFQDYFIDQTMEMAMNVPFIRGTMPWVLKDFRTPRRYHGEFQQYWNRKGLTDPEGNRKMAYFTLEKWYQKIENAYK